MNSKNQNKSKQNEYSFFANEDEGSEAEEQEQVTTPQNTMGDDGSVLITKNSLKIYCMTIIGQVEGHYILPPQNKATKYEHVIPQIVAVEEDDNVDGLLIILNTVGGDVEAGLAIAELIAGMKKPTVSLVLGGGHSIGAPLAVSAKKTYIARSASMTIHPVRLNGLVLGVPQSFEYFQRMQGRITKFVVENSGISSDKFTKLMMNTGELVTDVGTVLDGENAVEVGLIDSLGTLSDALASLAEMINLGKNQTKPRKPRAKSTKKVVTRKK